MKEQARRRQLTLLGLALAVLGLGYALMILRAGGHAWIVAGGIAGGSMGVLVGRLVAASHRAAIVGAILGSSLAVITLATATVLVRAY